jgi:hypothetical protein
MKNETTSSSSTSSSALPVPTSLACLVLTTGLVIGPARYAKGSTVHLTKPQADALLSLTPPAIEVVGI